jgi:hypothetical protein
MHKLTFAAATIAFGAMLASVPAQADMSGGGPKQKGGQCFTHSQSMEREGRFGFWGGCAQTASTPVAPSAQNANTRHFRHH